MRKIPTLFKRDWDGDKSRVVDAVRPECEWVTAGAGWPTRKLDGTACMIRDGRLYKRREVRDSDDLPPGFELQERDSLTMKSVGWVPVGDGPEDRWHREAFDDTPRADGTYELVGPKVQGNPENYGKHTLVRHDALMLTEDVPRDFSGLKEWLSGKDIEGIVFHHPDGRMAKIKLRDFGLKR